MSEGEDSISRAELVSAASGFIVQGLSVDEAIEEGVKLIHCAYDRLSEKRVEDIPDKQQRELVELRKALNFDTSDEVEIEPPTEEVGWAFSLLGVTPQTRESFRREKLSDLYERIIELKDPNKKGASIRNLLRKTMEERGERYLNFSNETDARSYLETYDAWAKHAWDVIRYHFKIPFRQPDQDLEAWKEEHRKKLEKAADELASKRSQKDSKRKAEAAERRASESGLEQNLDPKIGDL